MSTTCPHKAPLLVIMLQSSCDNVAKFQVPQARMPERRSARSDLFCLHVIDLFTLLN